MDSQNSKKDPDILDRLKAMKVPEYIFYTNDGDYQAIRKLARYVVELQPFLALLTEAIVNLLERSNVLMDDYYRNKDVNDSTRYALTPFLSSRIERVGMPARPRQRNAVTQAEINLELEANKTRVVPGYCKCEFIGTFFRTSLENDALIYCGLCNKVLVPKAKADYAKLQQKIMADGGPIESWYEGKRYKGASVKRVEADGTPVFEIRTAESYNNHEYTKLEIDEFVDDTPNRFITEACECDPRPPSNDTGRCPNCDKLIPPPTPKPSFFCTCEHGNRVFNVKLDGKSYCAQCDKPINPNDDQVSVYGDVPLLVRLEKVADLAAELNEEQKSQRPLTPDEVLAAAKLAIAVSKETAERAKEIVAAQSCIACDTNQPCAKHDNVCRCLGITREVNGCCAECGHPLPGRRDE